MADVDEYKKCMGDVFCWPRNKMRWHLMYPWTSRPEYGYRRNEQQTENPKQLDY
ncbi:hypothetical protein JYU34_001076 [Plutella xylostella]|uniref:Uncharacterized protein n=1 Tax=Plutella xylostella TaxID=51655 RepID=A0ABQ7R619_PLUXY|nr:hypothetical protein JYU34_001076 [Plutella xylostella]